MFPAYAGKILRVDLSTGKTVKECTPGNLIKEYVGGKGMGARLLYDEVKPGIDPLSPENKLIFTNGPATGTIVPNKGHIITFKSPLTNIYASSSSGGYFGPELKQAGYDALIIGGRSEKPVYLFIDDERVEIKDAGFLWGKDNFQTDIAIKEEIGDEGIKVARIGPAGEKLVRIASVINDYSRIAGRCGAGAVMGSKNLKAVAVRGTGDIEVAKIDELIDFIRELHKTMKEFKYWATFKHYGTPIMVNVTARMGVLPTKYWHRGTFDKYEEINELAFKTKMLIKDKGCSSCVLPSCGKLSKIKRGPYTGTMVEGPDYETIYAFGSLCENGDLESIGKANEICDKYGIDTISAGNLVAFTMDCYDRGIITTKETEGIEPVWGNSEAVLQLAEAIALRKGIGDTLAEGIRGAAKRLGKGAEESIIHVKGLEPAAFDPRGLKGMALAYAVADRGACHLVHYEYIYEFRRATDRDTFKGKAALVRDLEDTFGVHDSMILCFFDRDVYTMKTLGGVFPLLTGVKMEEVEFKRIGERIVNLIRVFNVREGISRKDDTLPKRFFEEPLPDGASKGMVLDKNEFNKALDEYYKLRGWNQNGIPSAEKLAELGLADIAKELETHRQKAA